MHCIDFDKIYWDEPPSEEERRHIEVCPICRIRYEIHLKELDQHLDDFLHDLRMCDQDSRASVSEIVRILQNTLPSTSPLKDRLEILAERAVHILPRVGAEIIAGVMAHLDTPECRKLPEDAFLERLKSEVEKKGVSSKTTAAPSK